MRRTRRFRIHIPKTEIARLKKLFEVSTRHFAERFPSLFRSTYLNKRNGMFKKKIASAFVGLFSSMLVMTGCGSSNTPSTQPPPAALHFAFVTNSQSNSVSTFVVDPTTGQLSPKDTVPTGGTNSRRITIDPTGHFAYVSNLDSNDISIFAVDAATGKLTLLSAPIRAGASPRIVLGPAGNVLYVVNQQANHITGFSINASTGALTPLSGEVPTDDA